MTMRIERLPEGSRAEEDVDCIHVEAGADGKFFLTGSTLCGMGDAADPESEAIISGEPYDSAQAAEDAGLAWAADRGVELLYVSRA